MARKSNRPAPPKKSKDTIKVLKNMLEYSAEANKAYKKPPYSKLNPETNSDSASAKSAGTLPHSIKIAK